MIPLFYPILDTVLLERRGCGVVDAARAMLDGGARILQFRHKAAWTRSVFHQAGQIAALCSLANALFIVNDRADVAAILGAGLHVGQDDLSPADARTIIGPGAVLGFSTHNAEQLESAAAEPLTYVALGPAFTTVTKDNPDPVIGLELFGRPHRFPKVAIGGITLANARRVIEAGADSLAVISALYPEPSTPQAIAKCAGEWMSLTASLSRNGFQVPPERKR